MSELLELSPFEDVANDVEEIEYIKGLLKMGHVIGYKNNTFAPNRFLTVDEFYIMCANPDIFKEKRALKYKDMVLLAREFAKNNNILINNASGNEIIKLAREHDIKIDEDKIKDSKKIKRIDVIKLIYELSKKVG